MTLDYHWRVLASAALLAFVSFPAGAAVWTCHGAKPGHPTAEERAQFVREVSALALAAEKKHGVPAAALAAIAIAESSYGWTRAALEAYNLFAWKAGPSAVEAGKSYIPPCDRRRGAKRGFYRFASRAEAVDYVASRLAQIAPYREHTEAYKSARKGNRASAAAVDAWVAGIAPRYSQKPERFVKKIRRIMNDPVDPSDVASPETTLYRLSSPHGASR